MGWHTGMTAYGDPAVRMRGGSVRAGLLEIEQEEIQEPSDEELEYLEKVLQSDVDLETEHKDEDIDFDKYQKLFPA